MTSLRRVTGEAFEAVTVDLDGCWFEDCSFTRCTLRFEGVETFGYAACHFDAVKIELHGVAEMVFGSLAGLATDDTLLAMAAALRKARPSAH